MPVAGITCGAWLKMLHGISFVTRHVERLFAFSLSLD